MVDFHWLVSVLRVFFGTLTTLFWQQEGHPIRKICILIPSCFPEQVDEETRWQPSSANKRPLNVLRKWTDRQVIRHDASCLQWQEYAIGEILHIFPSGTNSTGDRGSKKAYTGARTDIYLPTEYGCDQSIVVSYRSRNDRQTSRQTDKQNGMTIRLTLCERDATNRRTHHNTPHPSRGGSNKGR